jgi:hypothetical protein
MPDKQTDTLKKRIVSLIQDNTKPEDTDKDTKNFIMNSFKNLSEEDQFMFLCMIAKMNPENKTETDKEISELELFNKKELVRLKIAAIKLLFFFILTVGAIVIIFSVLFGAGVFSSTTGIFHEIQTIWGYFIG